MDIIWSEGKCRGMNPNLFYVPQGTKKGCRPVKGTYDFAKSVCHQCPIEKACLTFALDTEEEHGVWGGFDEEERRDMLTRLQRVS